MKSACVHGKLHFSSKLVTRLSIYKSLELATYIAVFIYKYDKRIINL